MICTYNLEHPKECILFITLYMELLCFFSNVLGHPGLHPNNLEHPKGCIQFIALYMELLFFSNVLAIQGYIQIKVMHPAQMLNLGIQ